MANAQLIDKINDEFITLLVKDKSKAYEEYIRAINRELINNIDNLDAKKVREIVNNQKLNIDDVVLLFAIQNAILLILEDRERAKLNKSLMPIVAVMAMYNIRKPKQFAERILRVSKGIGLNSREKTAKLIIDDFRKQNAKVLNKARKQAIKNMRQSVIKSKRNKRMLQDFRNLRKQNKPIEEIKNSLVRKYNKLSNINMALDTELHAQSEYVRQEHSIAVGYTHKVWKTQGDERVRDTAWHNAVRNKKVPIESKFRSGGITAMYPGDESLPAGERIRCRCYLIYV